jgi:hypothetical protein
LAVKTSPARRRKLRRWAILAKPVHNPENYHSSNGASL